MKHNVHILIVIILVLNLNPSQSQSPTCTNYVFQSSNFVSNSILDTSFNSCVDLPVLNSFLHWSYDLVNASLRIAYHHTGVDPSKWIVWSINPVEKGMVGSQCLVAYHNSTDGSMVVYTSPITSYGTVLSKGNLSFNVTDLSAFGLKDEIIIFATLKVPKNATTLNQVWQEGPLIDGSPGMHSLAGSNNVKSMASLNILSGVSIASDGGIGSSLKNIHGVLNAVRWGILMPMGAIVARYMRMYLSADPAWFYLHVGCQLSAYALGVAGWGTGLKLGAQSEGVEHSKHRNIGITLFVLGTIQMCALLIRPKKDHKYRIYWNIYHHSFGYTIIILSIINIMEGFEILNPVDVWKNTYIGIIGTLSVLAACLEGFTWYTFQKNGGHRDKDVSVRQVTA